MREDMEYIYGVLEELDAIVREASGVPVRRGRAIIDRADFLVMLDELRGSLPPDLEEAEAIRRECSAAVAAAEEEAERVVEEARRQAESLAGRTEGCQQARRRSAEIIDQAEHYAEEVSRGSELYRDQVMEQLEGWCRNSIASVGEARRELNEAPVRQTRPQRPQPVERRDTVERRDEEDGMNWRASSA